MRGKAITVAQELFEFAARKFNTEEPEEGRCLHYRTRIKYFESITRNQMNESKTIPKTHELHSVRSIMSSRQETPPVAASIVSQEWVNVNFMK